MAGTRNRTHPRNARVGTQNGKYRGGVYIKKGYRVFSAGPNRDRGEHVVIMEGLLAQKLCADYVFPDNKIPAGWDVEHCDHVRTHNCHGNLMLLPKRFHAKLSAAYRLYIRDHWDEYVAMIAKRNEVENTPDWVTSDLPVDGEGERVCL